MRTPNNGKNGRHHEPQEEHDRKHKVIAIALAVVLVVIIVAGIYILDQEGKINIAWLKDQNKQVANQSTPTSTENVDNITIEPESTPNSTPEPTEKVYIPDIGDLQELPDPEDIETTGNLLNIEIMAETSAISWDEYIGASYYVLAVYNSNYEQVQKDILWSNITTWQVPDFISGKVILYIYKDSGVDGTDDDEVIGTYAYEVLSIKESENISFSPAATKYYLLVDKESFAMGVFTYDENGQYTKLVHTFPCALGMTDRLTAIGVWEISSKGPWKPWSTGWYSPYYSRFTAGLYIHGAVYEEAEFGTLSSTSYEKIGTNSTSGCIRTTIEAAEWIYYNCPAGTIIEIVERSDLLVYPGKPAVDPDYPTWDPTDPNKPGN